MDAASHQILNGSKNDVGNTAAQISASTALLRKGITIKANKDNTAEIWIGGSTVTAGDNAATDGIPLAASESITLPIDRPSAVYVISSGTNQKAHWVGN